MDKKQRDEIGVLLTKIEMFTVENRLSLSFIELSILREIASKLEMLKNSKNAEH